MLDTVKYHFTFYNFYTIDNHAYFIPLLIESNQQIIQIYRHTTNVSVICVFFS